MLTMQAGWDVEADARGLRLSVMCTPPWWKFWAPRGRIEMVLDRKQAIIFYQTIRTRAMRAMLMEESGPTPLAEFADDLRRSVRAETGATILPEVAYDNIAAMMTQKGYVKT